MVPISSICHKCGIVAKSGKVSCCGRGGSWFGKCGRAGNGKVAFTWYEGVQTCKMQPRSEARTIRQSSGIQANNNRDSLQVIGMAKYKTAIATTKTVSFASVNTYSKLILITPSIVPRIYTPRNAFITTSARTLTNSTHTISSSNTPAIMTRLEIILYIYIWLI
mgnify:CR=1 FL=1